MISTDYLMDEFIKIIHNIGEKKIEGHPQIQIVLHEMQITINKLQYKYHELISSQQSNNAKKQKFTILNISNQSSIMQPQQSPQNQNNQALLASKQLPQQQQYQSTIQQAQNDHQQKCQQLIKLTKGTIIDKKYFQLKHKQDQDNCAIDLDNLFDDDDPNREVIELPCNHCFHVDCLINCVKNNSLCCPIDKAIYGILVGDQPEGQMKWKIEPVQCHGYYCDTIAIYYYFHDGIRNGVKYTGTARRAYLPNNQEGNEALNLLQRAFNQKLTFRVGDSDTTGQKNTVVWNVHHKTSLGGGPTNYGYPDPAYFQRLKDELAQKGIK